MTITHVLETHIHNDYVTGGLELARTVDAEYVVPAGTRFDVLPTSCPPIQTFTPPMGEVWVHYASGYRSSIAVPCNSG
ncbi:hypothetical protein MPSYJ_27970 [Mycolicibacterium psychrotolerans]|uniref:MBL fold metallo-hydrolase n=1 Tax=Mycolicibacterium psychrotolerans TaxID=216929 RepID=A0A7I7MB93_9MYCO|nr:hypothetical protein MPSYJ_27970 [Mycolicibacterium psychrotolerans]